MDGVREGRLRGGLPYLAFGAGPPLVVCSGLSPEHANPKGLARTIELSPLKPLGRRFTVYLVNRRPGLAPGTTMVDLAADYAGAIEGEFGRPVPVEGISTGGSVAQRLAIDHPQLVERLVLLASACRLSPYGRTAQRRLAELVAADEPRRAAAALGPALAASAAGGRLMAAALWLFGRRMVAPDPSDMIATIEAEDAFDASPELERVAAPTLVVGGGRDRFYSPELFRETAERIPRSRLLLYPGKGHAGSVSYKPAIREILAFLTADEPLAQPR